MNSEMRAEMRAETKALLGVLNLVWVVAAGVIVRSGWGRDAVAVARSIATRR